MSRNLNRPLVEKLDSQIGINADQAIENALKDVADKVYILYADAIATVIGENDWVKSVVSNGLRDAHENAFLAAAKALRHKMHADMIARLVLMPVDKLGIL